MRLAEAYAIRHPITDRGDETRSHSHILSESREIHTIIQPSTCRDKVSHSLANDTVMANDAMMCVKFIRRP